MNLDEQIKLLEEQLLAEKALEDKHHDNCSTIKLKLKKLKAEQLRQENRLKNILEN